MAKEISVESEWKEFLGILHLVSEGVLLLEKVVANGSQLKPRERLPEVSKLVSALAYF